MRVLLHTCCSSCLMQPLQEFERRGFSVASFFYNPNIQPFEEYLKRFSSVSKYAASRELEVSEGFYDTDIFQGHVLGGSQVRCSRCYRMRLAETVRKAVDSGYDAFSTTLLASSHQAVELIVKIGHILEAKHGVRFVSGEFGHGWAESFSESQRLGLYRQNYCGCLPSKGNRALPNRYHKKGQMS